MNKHNIILALIPIIANLVIVTSIVLMSYYVVSLVKNTRNKVEQFIRALALVTGFLIVSASNALNISITDMIFNAMKDSNIVFLIFAVVFPASCGVAVSWYFTYIMKHSSDFAIRIAILAGSFTLSLFSYLYIFSISSSGLFNIKAISQNAIFTISICLYLIFKLRTDDFKNKTEENPNIE